MGRVNNILITGATGYLGSSLLEAFVNNGYNIVVLKRKNSNVIRIERFLHKIKAYDTENLAYKSVFEDNHIDCVFHTAASYGRKGESLSSIYDANVFFPLQLLENCINYKVKYFFNANTTLPPDLNNYSLSKRQFSDILKLNRNEIKIVDIELQYFYGPNDDASKFITSVISKINQKDKSIDFSAGTQIRDFIYIKDVLSAYFILVDQIKDIPDYVRVPLGSGNGISLKSLVEKIKAIIGDNETVLNFGALPLRPGEIMNSVADIDFLTKLGWKPNYSLDQGLTETIDIEKSLQYDHNKQ